MTFVADSRGRFRVAVLEGVQEIATFGISGDAGKPFAPGQSVTIENDWLDRVWHRLAPWAGGTYEYRQSLDPQMHDAASDDAVGRL